MRLTYSTISTHRVTFADGALGERRRKRQQQVAVSRLWNRRHPGSVNPRQCASSLGFCRSALGVMPFCLRNALLKLTVLLKPHRVAISAMV